MAVATTALDSPATLAGVLNDPRQANGMQSADTPDSASQAKKITPEQIERLIAKFWKVYNQARKFDENFRKQIAVDRRYAAGTSDLNWAVTTNIIGAFIDILVALLYARDPNVSITKAPQTDNENTAQLDAFALTLQIVVAYLWRKGKLKNAARKCVRSVLSNGEGWFKCMMIAEKVPNAEVETALNDARELHARLNAQQKLIEDGDNVDPDMREAEILEKQALIEVLEDKLELSVNKMFVIDFIKTENIQVSTDVEYISDYLESDWMSNEMYIAKDDVLERFPELEPEDLKTAKQYYQTAPQELSTSGADNVLPQGLMTGETAQAFTTSSSAADESVPFLRVVERWHRTDKLVRTSIEGVKAWAKQPFTPPYPTSRFYPYFFVSFYEVDGARHPQSLSWRLYKLQDEYSSVRSNFRIARERSSPGVLFNSSGMDDEQAKKLEQSKSQEYVGINPSDPDTPLANLFAPKPIGAIDMRLYDPTLILSDMERVSGVQEALSAAASGPGNPKTATEANIEQSGTNARTTSNRDCLEWTLDDMANYTAEQALQALTVRDVQKIAGQAAFWLGPNPDADPPAPGMSIEDLFTLCNIAIKAGTTGNPKTQADQQAWSTILPLIRQFIGEIETALAQGNLPMVKALTALIQETMKRLGDEEDVDRFIPKAPPPGSPGAGAPPSPPKPPVSVSLRGEIDPQTAAALVAPDLPAPAAPVAPGPAGAAPGAPPPGPSTPIPPQPGQ